MKYMGSKNRHAKDIIPLILENHSHEMPYIEPFCGGCNILDKIPFKLKIGADCHEYLISLWKAVSSGWMPPEHFSEELYKEIKNNKDKYPPELVGYVGFALSYSGKWFGGWRRDSAGKRDYVTEAYKNAQKQFPKLLGVEFKCSSVFDLEIPKERCTIYCDPPYKDTTRYKDNFDHDRFYDWCRNTAQKGHNIFISEYSMPEDFNCIWVKKVNSSLTSDTGNKTAFEKLFTLRG